MHERRKPPRRRVDGVLLLDKPAGMSSNAALQKVRSLLDAAKAGHTGTLDPMATGLLPLCFGEATKFAGELLVADKCYAATMLLGVRTDTADAEGQVLEIRPVSVTREGVEAVLARFRGDIRQVPPMHSALKRDGRPLYEYARRGVEVERLPRDVSIYTLDLCEFEQDRVAFDVCCSKGTYIRTLADDIGQALGCGGHLTALRRTRIGNLRLEDAVTLDRLEELPPADRDRLLRPVDALLGGLPSLGLGDDAALRFGHGQAVRSGRPGRHDGKWRVYAGGRFIGLGRIDAAGRLMPVRLVATVVDK